MSLLAQHANRCKRLIPNMPSSLALAVSGGVDSMAMAYLTREALPNTRLVSFTIDHGVRPGSDKEAAYVASQLGKLGVDRSVVLLMGELSQRASKFELEARDNRARILFDACQQNFIRHLLLAHTKDDQLETYLMRRRWGSRLHGLAGMHAVNRSPVLPTPHQSPLWLVRPLLDVSKQQLYQVCEQNNVSWVEDPTNEDPELTPRNEIRQWIKAGNMPADAMDHAHQEITQLGAERVRVAAEADLELRRMVDTQAVVFDHGLGVLKMDLQALTSLDPEVASHVLLKAVEPIIPLQKHYYKLSDLTRLVRQLPFSDKTVANLKFTCDSGLLTVTRQRPYSPPRVIMPSVGSVWTDWVLFDNRIWIRLRTRGREAYVRHVVVTYPGDAANLKRRINAGELTPYRDIPFKLLHVQPVIEHGGVEVGVPSVTDMAAACGLEAEYCYKTPEVNLKGP